MRKEEFCEILGDINENHIEEARTVRAKNRGMTWTKWGAVAACLCLVIAAGIVVPKLIDPASDDITSSDEIGSSFVADAAPIVYVNDTLYKQSTAQSSYAELKEEFVYLGEIEDEVKNDQSISDGIPNKNFQANHPIVGSKIYQYGDDIVIEINGRYWLYEKYMKTPSSSAAYYYSGN